MAEVVGGKTKTIAARIAEVAAWFPALMALVAAGGASMLSTNHMVELPSWLQSSLDLYHGVRDQLMKSALGKAIPVNYADAAVMGIGLITMLSRKVLGFLFSVVGFILLAGVVWLVLHKFA